MVKFKVVFVSTLFFFATGVWAALSPPTTLLVDKKTNTLHLCEYENGRYKILKTYHATLGQVKGDKEDENDLKTPEGIYTFTAKVTPPTLQPKFGAMAFYLNFPNSYDRLAGRTGNGIMLHATNEPERLKKNYDSQGCVVVENEEIREISSHIRLGLTPILIFSELTPEFMQPSDNGRLRAFFDEWLESWRKKDIEHYIASYHSDFSADGKDKRAWKTYKSHLNDAYTHIDVKAEDVLTYRHPKYSMITFTQDYRSTRKGGGVGHRSQGTKVLFVAEEAGNLKIIAESFSRHMW